MAARYLLDEMMAGAIVAGLERRGITAHSISSVRLAGEPDDVVFEVAIANGLTLVTSDARGFLPRTEGFHHGLLMYTQQVLPDPGSIIRAIEAVHLEYPDGLARQVLWLARVG